MKVYTLAVVIQEGCDEFWEGIEQRGSTGCNEVVQMVRDILFDAGLQPPDCTVTLQQFQR